MSQPKTKEHDSQEPDNSDKGTTNLQPTRCDCLYFKDGNIVLIAQNTAFRVHKGLLGLHSDVFRNMFDNISQLENAEMFDGCSVVRLSDGSGALETFLKALYMIEPIRYAEDPGVYFPHVLRLATKYLCNTLRKQSLEQFGWEYFPDTLVDWDTRDDSLVPEDVIILARDIKAEILLPAAFYHFCQDGPETGDLNQNDFVTAWIGDWVITSFWPMFLKKQMVRRDDPPCDHHHCRKAWRAFWEKKTLEALEKGQISAGMDPLSQLEQCPNDLDGVQNVCWEAKRKVRKSCDAKREEIWNKLPEIFGLDSWAKLRAAGDASCDDHVESSVSSADSSGDEEIGSNT